MHTSNVMPKDVDKVKVWIFTLLGGFFGIASKTDCVMKLFFGVDYQIIYKIFTHTQGWLEGERRYFLDSLSSLPPILPAKEKATLGGWLFRDWRVAPRNTRSTQAVNVSVSARRRRRPTV